MSPNWNGHWNNCSFRRLSGYGRVKLRRVEQGRDVVVIKTMDRPQSGQPEDAAGEIGAENLSDMFDKLIGQMGRNAAFPPCKGCGLAMEIAQITPTDDTNYEERMFRCSRCGVLEAKTVEIR
jgi:hypothetical protein